jgi:hypothetical protein
MRAWSSLVSRTVAVPSGGPLSVSVLSWTLRASAAASPCGERACFEFGEHGPQKTIARATTEDRFGVGTAPWCRASADAGEWRVSGAQSPSAPPDTQTTDPTALDESEVTLGARWALHGQRDIICDAKWCQPEGLQAPGGAGGVTRVAGMGQMKRIAPAL